MPLPFLPPVLINRLQILSKFVSIQLVIQAIGMASGIFLVRTLDKQEYAYFTIANTMQGTMNLLADMGISSGLLAIGGKVWQDRYRFGQLINTAMQLRRKLATIAIALVTPLLLWLLFNNGTSIFYAILITITVLIGLSFQLSTVILGVVPRLHSQLNYVQSLDFISAIFRLSLLVVAYFTFLNAGIAILTASIALGLQQLFLSRWVIHSIDRKAPVYEKDKLEILQIVKTQAPNALFFCIHGQLTIWLISIFGNTQSIAEVGALGRLGVIFSLIYAVMQSIILPSFSRCQSVIKFRDRYWQVLVIFCAFGACLIAIANFFPKELLFVLGQKYAHLKQELLLIVVINVLNGLSAIMLSINTSKGWLQYYWLNIPCIILIEAVMAYFLDLSTTYGVLLLAMVSVIPGLICSGAITYINLLRWSVVAKE